MSGLLVDSPAAVVANALVAIGLSVQQFLPTPSTPLVDWMTYIDNEPNVPDNCITVYNTVGIIDYQTHPDAETCLHEGIQIRVRSVDEPTGYTKANRIAVLLMSSVNGMKVAVGMNSYLLQAAIQKGPINALYRESAPSRRRVFTINYVVALRQLPYANIPALPS